MTAGHYIALLLLSTAEEGSVEHTQVIVQNGPGVWLALREQNLVEREAEQFLWRLSDRGRALVEHVLTLPLPEQVTAWRMPGALIATPASLHTAMQIWQANAGSVTWVDAEEELPLNAGTPADDGPPPPKPPAPKPIPGITPAEDPQDRRAQVLNLINRGFGTSEIATTLEMSQGEVDAIFFAGS